MSLDEDLKKETHKYQKYETQTQNEIEQAIAMIRTDDEEEEELNTIIDQTPVSRTKPRFPFFDERIEELDLYDPEQAAEYTEFMRTVKGVGRIQQLRGEQGW